MRGFNKAIIMGNVTRDPEIRYTASQKAVASFSVAVNRSWKDANGELREEVAFIPVVVWGKPAETCERYMKKGAGVRGEGRINTRSYESKTALRSSPKRSSSSGPAATKTARTAARIRAVIRPTAVRIAAIVPTAEEIPIRAAVTSRAAISRARPAARRRATVIPSRSLRAAASAAIRSRWIFPSSIRSQLRLRRAKTKLTSPFDDIKAGSPLNRRLAKAQGRTLN